MGDHEGGGDVRELQEHSTRSRFIRGIMSYIWTHESERQRLINVTRWSLSESGWGWRFTSGSVVHRVVVKTAGIY